MSRLSASLLICLVLTSPAAAQEFLQLGMLATETMSRTRLGGSHFQAGDMMYVSVLHSANTGDMYVSSHMEYFDANNGKWRPIPTRNTELGRAYTSGQYPGVRDYVQFDSVDADTERNVCLFMPYEAASVQQGAGFRRRYVLRLWDNDNEEVKAVVLPEELVNVESHKGKTVITLVKAKACAASPFASNEPIPETRRESGLVRFFNPKNGAWVCPSE